MNIAKNIAIETHKNEFRRDGKTPYIVHPQAVAEMFKDRAEIYRDVAFLHDTMESNNKITVVSLMRKGITKDAAFAVEALTHRKGESYENYVKRVMKNDLARIVKIADILVNLSDDPTPHQVKKYTKALKMLLYFD